MGNSFKILAIVCVLLIIVVVPCWGGIPLTKIDTDANEKPAEPNIKDVYAGNDAEILAFKFTSYKNWAKDIVFDIFLDVDRNANTGNQYGTEYAVELSITSEKEGLFGGVYKYDPDEDKFVASASVSGILAPNGNQCEIFIKRTDIGNPDALDFDVAMFVTADWLDFAPDEGRYTYRMSGGSAQGNPSITASPTTVKSGENITVKYSNAPGNPKDWIGMYRADDTDRMELAYEYLNGNKSGTLTFKAPREDGDYNFRMFPNDESTPRLAISNTVTVGEGDEIKDVKLIIPEVSGIPGQPVTIPIDITNASGVAGVDIDVSFDPDFLTILDVKGTTLSSDMSIARNLDNPNKVMIRMAQQSPLSRGSGALVEMEFLVNPGAIPGTETPVRFEKAEVFDDNATNINIGTQNGKVKIVSPQCTKGDVNGNGKVQSSDASLALQISAETMIPTPREFCAADYNSDNAVKSNDAVLILKKSAGVIAAPGRQLMAGGPIAIIIDGVYGGSGKMVSVPLKVDKPEMLSGGDICVTYDRTLLKSVAVLPNENVMMASNISRPGMIRMSFVCTDGLNAGIMANIKFLVIGNDSSPLRVDSHELYGHDGGLLNSKVIAQRFIYYQARPEYSLLHQNFPNPFNPETWLPFQLNEPCEVDIKIFDSNGKMIRNLALGHKPAGLYLTRDRAAYWDGKDDSGSQASSGAYFYTIKAGEFSDVKKMIITK